MDNIIIEDLINRIATEPSVLFLGQDYLRSRTGSNLFYDIANQKLCGGKLSPVTDYSKLWKTINNGKPLTDADFVAMAEILSEIPEQSWLRKILGMRWGMIVTSSVDAALFRCVGSNFTMSPVGMDIRSFNKNYISKQELHVSLLYGSIGQGAEFYPLAECSRKSFSLIRKKVNDRIGWIYSNILADYGVFVIDGWNPEYDWLKNLLDEAGEMPQNSIFLFGATDNVMENEDVASLCEAGILNTVELTFAEALDKVGFFDEEELAEEYDVNDNGRLITLKIGRENTVVTVSFDTLSQLDSRITVLYDDIWLSNGTRDGNREQMYAQFQKQTDTPIWHLYHPKYGFYFDRTLDKLLADTVSKELHNDSYKRKYIILEGNSNTGKTMSLVHLAYIMRSSAPVIYISGEPNQPNWMEHLKNFIKEQLVEKKTGKWIDSVIVIWDANTDYNAPQRCKQLQETLRECNTVVVGSAYPRQWENDEDKPYYKDTVGNHHLILTAKLDKTETTNLLRSIKTVNTDLYEQLKAETENSTYLLSLLQKIVHLEYDTEWKQVASELQKRFNQEVNVNEDFANVKLEEFNKNLAKKVDEEIMKYGVAASWQLKLAQIKKEHFNSSSIELDQPSELLRFERMDHHIKKMNKILAVTGEFSVDVPLTLILRMVGDVKHFSDEQLFLVDVIKCDSLLRTVRDDKGYYTVNFRHPSEATMYIKNNFGISSEEIKEKEVAILIEMIRECNWDDEAESLPVLALARGFGPNSRGTFDHPRKQGTRHYQEYANWWKQIASELKNATDDQPETILVYALLIRRSWYDQLKELKSAENATQDINRKREVCVTEIGDAMNLLRNTIEHHRQNNKNQYCRLLGEMCSNLVFVMLENLMEDYETSFSQLKDYFSRTVKNWPENNSQNLFTKNALLDIWLNGVRNYFKLKIGDLNPMENPECVAVVADSISYIDMLLDLSEEGFDHAELLDKIDCMYQYAGSDHLNAIQEKLKKSNNDSCLYLEAWRCWQLPFDVKKELQNSDDYIAKIGRNLYLLPDDLDRWENHQGSLCKLKGYARQAAQNAIEILEAGKTLIESSKSSRCIYMLIRAKWLVYTGYMPLEMKQHPILSVEQWKEIGELCGKYILYADRNGEQLRTAPVLFRMIYIWCFTKDNIEFDSLRKRQNMLATNEWFFERICLCEPGTDIPRQFNINLHLKRGTDRKYIATINNDGKKDILCNCTVGKKVHVSDAVAQRLMGNNLGSEKYNINQPVIIWFNAKGPQIGFCEQKGDKAV